MDAKGSGGRFRKALRLPFRRRRRPSHLDPLYHPLRSDNREIRLLQIDPSQPDEVDIHCSFKTVSLNSAPVYQALSYEWGPPEVGSPSSRVFVNLHNVPTTPNLRRALKHLETGTSYWIDAICIDQRDDKERGHQVRLMTEIYRHAGAVVVWLGSEKENSAAGMFLLNEVGAFIDAEHNADNSAAKLHDWVYKTLSDRAYDTHWNGLEQIYSRSYWRRLWVIQELVVTTQPDKVRLLCGSDKAQFIHLRMLNRKIYDIATTIPRLYYREPLDATIHKLRRSGERVRKIAVHGEAWANRNAKDLSIVRLLDRHCQLLCADPRDKVYALLGVSYIYPEVELPITYRIPVHEVYKNLAKYAIEGSKSLDILQYCGDDGETPRMGPSWVPDWQHDNGLRMVQKLRNASGTRSSVARFSSNDNILVSPAFVLGTITDLHETNRMNMYISDATYQIIFEMCRNELSSWLGFITSNLRPANNPAKSVDSCMKTAWRNLFSAETFVGEEEDRLPFWKFVGFFDQRPLDLPEGDRKKEYRPTFQDISMVVSAMRRKRHLCAIQLAPSIDVNMDQGSLDLKIEKEDTTIGVCYCKNAKVDDVVAVIVGCRNPLLLRRKNERFQVIGNMWVLGFMHGEALKKFEEVEIELV
ncbi:HET-domain-containing protein [Hyaloscypha hepaticicola]|uniref:HET-domain-containing protein n=1 Tax=Hyaloscypha hepaticicola TaxID=2082293 RepID=A0A2J6PHM0_9HELO|nr:HET-domain-containing protein [Hyaloscypha hepaticicola]